VPRLPLPVAGWTLRERAGHVESIGRLDTRTTRSTRWEADLSAEVLEIRLATANISRAVFESVNVKAPYDPIWLTTLEHWLNDVGQEVYRYQRRTWDRTAWDEALKCILPLARSLVGRALCNLNRSLQRRDLRTLDSNPALLASSVKMLAADIDRVALPIIALEVNVARLQGLLSAQTSRERYQEYSAALIDSEKAARLLSDYPVLLRAVHHVICDWQRYLYRFLLRFFSDRELLTSTFGIRADMPLNLERLGDRHRGGQAVLRLRFEDGSRLIYKPRSLAIDVWFQRLLGWYNEQGADPALQGCTVLERGSYGWMEYIDHEPCKTDDERRRFFKRQGLLLALLHAIQARDCHKRNVIARGDMPFVVDLETVLQAHVARRALTEPLSARLSETTLAIGYLPGSFTAHHPEDLSVLGAARAKDTVPAFFWKDLQTDSMQLASGERPVAPDHHHPGLDANANGGGWLEEEVLIGFEQGYRLCLRHRHTLLRRGGLLSQLEGVVARVVLRRTAEYSAVLFGSYHPDHMRNALDREMWLDQLWKRPPCVCFREVTAAECDDLERGDIPLFVARVGSRVLRTSSGRAIRGVIARSARDVAREHIRSMSESDLVRQQWIIAAALATVAPESLWRTARLGGNNPPLEDVSPMAAALAIGKRIAALAHSADGHCTWFSLRYSRAGWRVGPLGADLYDGLPGVALFLASLADSSSDDEYEHLARSAIQSCQRMMQRAEKPIRTVGGYLGLAGVLFATTELARMWQANDLFEGAVRIAELIDHAVEADEDYDLMSGCAGAIPPLLNLYDMTGNSRAIETALHCGRHLTASALPQAHGVGWMSKYERAPLVGFAHGASGIGCALLELAAASGYPCFADVAYAAFDYERSTFVRETGQWPDLRASVKDAIDQHATGSAVNGWCHGAVGIALARLRARELGYEDTMLKQDLQLALAAMDRRVQGRSHCLCHGDMGHIDVLMRTGEITRVAEANAAIRRAASQIVSDGIRTGFPLSVDTPGLMTGLSGVGLMMLRSSAASNHFPDVLALRSSSPN